METVTLHVEPNTAPVSWTRFSWHYPARSVALDGFVSGEPRFADDLDSGPHANFNHHEDVNRLATRSTCAQVLMAIRQGFSQLFGKGMHVYVNDCDQDVCMAIWLLRHMPLAENPLNPLINRLVSVTDMLDSTAGSFPYPPELDVLRELEWIFEPYRITRKNGIVDRRDPRDFESVIESVGHRIDQYIVGKGDAIDIDANYHVSQDCHSFILIDESKSGSAWRTGFFAHGHYSYIAFRKRPDGRYVYTIGRLSEYIPFPVLAIFHALNLRENLIENALSPDMKGFRHKHEDRWGGSPLIGGSPRVAGTALEPTEVMRIASETIVEDKVRRYERAK